MSLSPVITRLYSRKAAAFEKSTTDPEKAQRDIIFEYLRRNRETVYGREYGFGEIRSIEEYQERVPIVDYEKLRPYVERLLKGEKDILTSDKTIFFGMTSGTTGQPKYIPVTEYSRRLKKDVMNLYVYYALRDHPHLLDGNILAVVSPEVESRTESGIPCGAESGHAYRNLPWLIKKLYVVPYEVFTIRDYDARYYCILRFAMEADVTTIATLNPSTIMLLCHRIDDIKEMIIDDIAQGTINPDLDIPKNVRRLIQRRLRPNPKRAEELASYMAKNNGRLLPKDIWPNLAMLECWKGGTVGMYLSHFAEYFGRHIPVRDFGYLATEARISIPMTDEGASAALAINSNFYEFIPKIDSGACAARPFLAHQLECGREYNILVTTAAGLYRYNIDDVIKVTGFYNSTPLIEFKQKGAHVSSITGEKLYESQVDEAVNKAACIIGAQLAFFSACVEWGSPPRYSFLVEITNDLPRENKREFLKKIENEIMRLNIEYAAKRESMRLGHPILKLVPRGTLNEYKMRKAAAGAYDGQFKMPELTTNSNFQHQFTVEEEISVE